MMHPVGRAFLIVAAVLAVAFAIAVTFAATSGAAWHCQYHTKCLHRVVHRQHREARAARARRLAREPVAQASWYDDKGATACGIHAAIGVAHRTLPCGTHVELCAARCAVATVQDRGPAAWTGRDFDLNVGAKAALGFGDVGVVRWRIVR